jgi:hypothetical protein
MTVTDGFVVRRLAPDSRKAELSVHPDVRLAEEVFERIDEKDTELQNKLLDAMGREIGSLHAATAHVPTVLAHLKGLNGRDSDWLHSASKKAAQAVEDDFKAWTEASPPQA